MIKIVFERLERMEKAESSSFMTLLHITCKAPSSDYRDKAKKVMEIVFERLERMEKAESNHSMTHLHITCKAPSSDY